MNFVFGYLIFAVTLIQSGFALRCWHCSSDLDPGCYDHFNTTKLLQFQSNYGNANYNPQFNVQPNRNSMPTLLDCNVGIGQMYGQKAVCLKEVVTEPSGRQRVSRECKVIPLSQDSGKCPNQAIGRGFSIDFCEYCEYDGCNSATNLYFNKYLILLALTLFVFLRK